MAFPVDANSAYGSVREILHRNCRASEYERGSGGGQPRVGVGGCGFLVVTGGLDAKLREARLLLRSNTANIAPICHNCHNCTRTSGGV